jgi:RNA polymerase sigma-70 factor (ECF subfamily)
VRAGTPRIEDLVERFAPPVYRLALRMTGDPAEAEDVVQETFLLAERGLPRFDVERPVAPWLFKVATNACLTRCRARRRRRNHERGPKLRVEETRRPEAVVDAAEAREAVAAAVLELAPIYRAVVTLFYLKELSLEEVAATLGIPAGTAKVRLFRARALLAARLKAFAPIQTETGPRRPA